MKLQIIQPPAILKNYVRYFWTLDLDQLDYSQQVLKILADRHPRLIIQHLDGRSAIQDHRDHNLPVSFLSGVTTRQTTYSINSSYSHTGVSFYPHGLHRIFRMDAYELTNELPDLAEFCPQDKIERLMQAKGYPERIRLLARLLIEQMQTGSREDGTLTEWMLRGDVDCENTTVEFMLKKFSVGERQLERKFKESIGISPKTYLRISRFEKTVDQLIKGTFGKLQDIALDSTYADHSHFIREFKEFSGYNPTEFLAESKFSEESSSFLVDEKLR